MCDHVSCAAIETNTTLLRDNAGSACVSEKAARGGWGDSRSIARLTTPSISYSDISPPHHAPCRRVLMRSMGCTNAIDADPATVPERRSRVRGWRCIFAIDLAFETKDNSKTAAINLSVRRFHDTCGQRQLHKAVGMGEGKVERMERKNKAKKFAVDRIRTCAGFPT